MIETISTIVKSPMLEKYNIGLTMNSNKRRGQYKNFDPTWPHFVILKSGLSAKMALKMERDLFNLATKNKRTALYKKYRADRRDSPYKPGLGGLSVENENKYDVYIAWGNVGDN